MRHRTRSWAAAAAAALVLTAGAGCSSSSSKAQAKTDPAAAVASGGALVTNIGEPEKLLTTFANEAQGISVLHALYKGLIDYDPKTGEPVDVIADSIASPDSKVWTIKLKAGFSFDNGEPVDADAFIRAWNYSAYAPNAQDDAHFFDKIVGFDDLQGKTPAAQQMSGLAKVDDHTLQVTLKAPYAVFPKMLGFTAFYPNAKACVADMKACNEKPIGDGPFKMDGAWQHNQQITVVRSNSYGGAKAKLDKITFRIYDKLTTAYVDMSAGELDLLYAVPAAKFKEAVAKFGDKMVRQPTSDFNYLAMPTYADQMNNPKIREALSMAFDRQPIIDALFDGQFTPAKSVISPVVAGSRKDACQFCVYDPAKAKQLLADAGGWPAGQKLELWCNSGGGHEKWLQAIGDQVKTNLGIDYEIKCDLPFAQYLSTLLDPRKATGPFRMRWSMDYPSTDNYLRPMYTEGAPGNFMDYSNPRVDALIAQGDLQQDTAGQLKYYQQAEDLVLTDLPVIPLWFGVSSVVRGDRVTNLTVNPATGIDWGTVAVKK